MSLDSETVPLGQRERRKAESRERLIETARNVFVERGYHGTRRADIAEAADLAVETVYLHFADKREIFAAFTEQAGREVLAAIGARLRGVTGFENRMHAACEAVLDYAARSSSPIGQPEATHDPARLRREGALRPRVTAPAPTRRRATGSMAPSTPRCATSRRARVSAARPSRGGRMRYASEAERSSLRSRISSRPRATRTPPSNGCCFSRAWSRRHGDRAPREGTSQGPWPR